MTDDLSPVAAALAARGRKIYPFLVNDFFDLGQKQIFAIGFRVAVKAEDDAAIIEAHKYAHEASKSAGDAAEAARKDLDLLTDAKTIEALYRVCRRVDLDAADPTDLDKAKETIYSAFATPTWMRKTLTTDQIAVLLNLYIEVKRRESRGRREVTDEHVEKVATVCQAHAGDDVPTAILADYPREILTEIVVQLALKLAEARTSVETLLAQSEAQAGSEDVEPVPFEP
jgi:hypothetical protein